MRQQKTILQNIDWLMVSLYLVLVIIGWMNIFASSYSTTDKLKIFDFTKNYGKQVYWIGTAVLIALAILIIDGKFYAAFSYPIYGLMLFLMILVLFVSRNVKGAHEWVDIGSFKFQPSEFAKFATNMALAKYLSTLDTKMQHTRTKLIAAGIILLPMAIILKQNDTGSALVFISFILVLYREGLSGNFLLFGVLTAVLFVLTLLLDKVLLICIIAGVCVILFLLTKRKVKDAIPIAAGLVVALAIVFSVSYVSNHVLQEHQRTRINILLGKEVDIKKDGYNVNQSKIAIGSGGFFGKGFMQGTLTKGEFIPEQSTDFIFCTVGEEWGFIGTFVVISLFTVLLLRVIYVAERQRSTYSRLYGYGVASILFFHMMVNVGMTIGLAPVIGIPFPFFSYGGSSLWSFTILLFIFIKLDAYRLQILR